MNKTDLKKLKKRLEEDRDRILAMAEQTESEEKAQAGETPVDEVDIASDEVNWSITRRLRDRERLLLGKIDKALKRVEDGTVDECESCGGPIGVKRLMARPVTTLCITCKEEQERVERGMAS